MRVLSKQITPVARRLRIDYPFPGRSARSWARSAAIAIVVAVVDAGGGSSPASAQLFNRRRSVWGAVEGASGEVVTREVAEVLAATLIAQLVLVVILTVLILRRRAWAGRMDPTYALDPSLDLRMTRIERAITLIAYALAPALAALSMVYGVGHQLLGMGASSIALVLFAALWLVAVVDALASP